MRSVSRTAWAVVEVPEGSGSVAVAVAGACSDAGYSGCYCCFRYHHCTEAVTNAVVVCDHCLPLIFLLHRLHHHGVDAFAAGVAIARSAHPASAAFRFSAGADALPADDARLDHSAVAGAVVAAAAARIAASGFAVAAVVVLVFAVDGDGGAAVDVDPSTSPIVCAFAEHAVHAVLPSADHVIQ